MLLYLIRHADAVEALPDRARELSEHGREQVVALAKFLRRTGKFCPDEVWHSTLVRARQTAELLLREVGSDVACKEVPGITPDDDPRAIVGQLTELRRSVALVGHEPYLSALGSLLVTGRSEPVVFAMKKGATLALERGTRGWVVRWHVAPGLFA